MWPNSSVLVWDFFGISTIDPFWLGFLDIRKEKKGWERVETIGCNKSKHKCRTTYKIISWKIIKLSLGSMSHRQQNPCFSTMLGQIMEQIFIPPFGRKYSLFSHHLSIMYACNRVFGESKAFASWQDMSRLFDGIYPFFRALWT